MFSVEGVVHKGIGDFTKRMKAYPDAFKKATGENLFLGTLNVKVPMVIPIKEDFRIKGIDIDEPDQDLLFEKCIINELPAYRIRPFNLLNGFGGHGDNILEITCSKKIPNANLGKIVCVRFFRRIF